MIIEVKAKLSNLEDEKLKMKNTLEKEIALKDQKLTFNVKELANSKDKLEESERDKRDLMIQLKQTEKLVKLYERKAVDKEEELKK